MNKRKNCSPRGGGWGYCRGFAKKTMPHMWRIIQIWFDKSPSLAHMPQVGGWGLQLIGALQPKHFKSFTVAKLDFTIHRLSNGRSNCGLNNTAMQPFMQQVQINIESTNLSEQTQPVLLSLLILFTVANLVLVCHLTNPLDSIVGLDV